MEQDFTLVEGINIFWLLDLRIESFLLGRPGTLNVSVYYCSGPRWLIQDNNSGPQQILAANAGYTRRKK